MTKGTILLVEDESDAIELVRFNLKQAGYRVLIAGSAEKALEKTRGRVPDLIILDLMLPGMDGLELCRVLRRNPKTAHVFILILTARATEVDRVLGLELGADDFMAKPFSPRELVLRINRLLNRHRHIGADLREDEYLALGALSIDLPRHEVTVLGKAITLTPTEFKLLTLLARRRERVQSRDALLQELWGCEGDITSRAVDTHMRRLRSKLGRAAKHLSTVRGFGYCFTEQA